MSDLMGRMWRLVSSAPADAFANMAADETLMRSFNPHKSLPVLRLYSWAPAALSVGRFQNVQRALSLDRCVQDGLPVVRRMTGGGAIYHAHELTYSLVCAPETFASKTSIQDSFRLMTQFLFLFYRRLGLDPHYACDVVSGKEQLGVRTGFCFAGYERFDILVNGRKIGGNAQRRTRDIVFQHGSVPLSSHVAKGLSYMRETSPDCCERTTSLMECGVVLPDEQLHAILATSFSDSYGAVLREIPLTEDEKSINNQLIYNKYRTDSWNVSGEFNGN